MLKPSFDVKLCSFHSTEFLNPHFIPFYCFFFFLSLQKRDLMPSLNFVFKLLSKRSSNIIKCHVAILGGASHHADYEGGTPLTPTPMPRAGRTDLRANLDAILLMRPVDVPLRACASAPASCAGDAGGPLYAALRRSRSCSPWNVLRLELPRGNRVRSRSRSGVAALML